MGAARCLPLDEVERRLENKVVERVGASRQGDLAKGQLGLRKAFDMFEPSPETDEITQDTFRQVLARLGFTGKDALALFAKFDQNQNGSLDIEEFSKGLMGKDNYKSRIRRKAPSKHGKNLQEYLCGPASETINDND